MYVIRGYHIVIIIILILVAIALQSFVLWVVSKIPTGDTETCNSVIDYGGVRNARTISIIVLVLAIVVFLFVLIFTYYRRRRIVAVTSTTVERTGGGIGIIQRNPE